MARRRAGRGSRHRRLRDRAPLARSVCATPWLDGTSRA